MAIGDSLTFAPGGGAQNFTITALTDALTEGNETVTLQLFVVGTIGITVANPQTVTITEPGVIPPTDTPTATAITNITPGQTSVFDPAISQIGLLQPGQVGVTGEQVEWIVTVSNPSGVGGSNVVVTDTLRPELRLDRVVAPNGAVNLSGQRVTVTYGTLAPGQSFQFSIFSTVLRGSAVDNTAGVQAAGIGAEGVTVPLIRALPAMGEAPWWGNRVRALIRLLLIRRRGHWQSFFR